MNKLTKGALAMVLTGTVTFSVTNALLVEQSYKRLTEENPLIAPRDEGKENILSKVEKPEKVQTQTIDKREDQPKLTHNSSAFQVASKNRNKSEKAIVAPQQNPKKSSKSTLTNTSTNKTKTTTSVVKTKPVISNKTSTLTPTATSTATGTNSTLNEKTEPTTSTKVQTITNRGQQVSQAAKEKAVGHRDKTENKRK